MKSIFVYNPESGNGKIAKYKDYILAQLSQKYGQIDCVETTHQGHVTEIAKDSIGKYDYFFIAGGDGTLNELINGLGNSENKPIIGYIPAGTVNDVAHSLGLSKNIKKATKILLTGQPFDHDIFMVNKRFGIYVCCTGLFSKTSYDTKRYQKKKLGKLAYFFRGVKELYTTKPTHIKLEAENISLEKYCSMLLILNSRSAAGFLLNKKASLSDGEVEVVIFHSHPKRIWLSEVLRAVSAFLFGINWTKKSKYVTYHKLSSFKITLDENTVINLDGEKSGNGTFNFKVINKGISIIVPPKYTKKDTKRKSKQN